MKRLKKINKARKRRSTQWESKLCQALWTWFFHEFKAFRESYLRIEVGGQRSKLQQGILKSEGAKAGTSDVFIAVPINGFHGFWLEVKTGKTPQTQKGRMSPAQKEFQDRMMSRGYFCATGYGIDECKKLISDYLNGKIERVLPDKAMFV